MRHFTSYIFQQICFFVCGTHKSEQYMAVARQITMTTAVNNAQYTTNMNRSSQLRKSKYDIKGRLEAIFLTFILLLSWHRVAWWWKAKFDEYVKGSTDCSLRRNDQFLIFSTERQARCALNKNSNLARPCMMMAKWFCWSNLLLMNIHTVPRQRSTHLSFNGNCTFFSRRSQSATNVNFCDFFHQQKEQGESL